MRSGHTGNIQALAFSADGRWIASGGYDHTVIVWQVSSGAERWRFPIRTEAVTTLAISPDSHYLVGATARGEVKSWDLTTGATIYSARTRSGATAATFAPDGKSWAVSLSATSSSTGAAIELRDSASGQLLRTIAPGWDTTTAAVVTSDGSLVASGEIDVDDEQQGSTQSWKLSSGEKLRSYPIVVSAFSADARFAAQLNYADHSKISVFDMSSGQAKRSFAVSNPGAVFISPDGQEVVATDPMHSELKVWSVATGAEIKSLPGVSSPGALGLSAAAFSLDGKSLAAAAYPGYSIKTWDLTSGRELRSFDGQSPVQGLATSPDGQLLAVSSALGVNVWNLNSWTNAGKLFDGPSNFLSFSADGRWLASNPGKTFPGELLRVWDLANAKTAVDFTFSTGGTPVNSAAFIISDSPLTSLGPISRSFQFTANDGKHTLWSGPSTTASSPDGKLLVTQSGMGGTLSVWDIKTGQKMTTLLAHSFGISTVAFSPDGRSLITTGAESQAVLARPTPVPSLWGVKVWNVADWRTALSLTFSRVGAPCAIFSPDGRYLAVEKSWERVEVLDASNGALAEVLTATDPNPQYHQFSARNLAFSQDGKFLFEGAQNGIREWKLSGK